MFPAFDVFSVLTKGYACGLGTTGYQAFALMSKGYLCDVAVRRGGDPKGAWGNARSYFERQRRQRDLARGRVTRETSDDLQTEIDVLELALEELALELSNIRVQDTPLLQLDLVALQAARAERDAFAGMQIEEIRRDNVVFLKAFRAQARADELARLLEIGRQIKRQLQDELAVAIAIIAILFK